jgi:hypothetical protein
VLLDLDLDCIGLLVVVVVDHLQILMVLLLDQAVDQVDLMLVVLVVLL